MALWQFTLDLIPSSAAKVNGVDAIQMTREQLDEIEPEIPTQKKASLFQRLDALLSEKEPWSPDLRIWGDEKSHDVQIWLEGGRIESFQLRLDVANPSFPIIDGMCSLARDLQCVFAAREGAIIQPSAEAIARAVMQSPAMRFVRDPEGFIRAAIQSDSSKH